ncbi:MAG: DNA-binding protein WhiA [Vallitaleaceae bacterium]|jgi:DNA-binding protein WhiA|nr:DNA-binding protein WhiA [Vallitaleaceae bacterium]
MSFSTKVKDELVRHTGEGRHCKIAEVAAIINMCGKVREVDGKLSLKVQSENPAVARKYFTILKKTFNINVEILIRRNRQLKKNYVYSVFITEHKDTMKVLKATHIIREQNGRLEINHHIDSLIVASTCCKRAYIRGAFIAGGSLSDPEKTYHLEFVNVHEVHSIDLVKLINSFELDAKMIQRKKYFVVYLKEGRQIVDLLNITEAHIALMELENLRILKEMRNNVNRMVNCETANISKTVHAAVKQYDDIMYIDETIGIHQLAESLEAVAKLRVENRDASLKELGAMLDPPVGKSGVNHRLRKISAIADRLRGQQWRA